jgi:hypothetical protein
MTATSAIRQKRTLLCNAWCDRMHDGGRICNLECRVDAGQGFFCGHGWLLQVGERYSREVQQRRLVGRLPHLQESIRAGRLSGPVHPPGASPAGQGRAFADGRLGGLARRIAPMVSVRRGACRCAAPPGRRVRPGL